jgi:hypothetical protein
LTEGKLVSLQPLLGRVFFPLESIKFMNSWRLFWPESHWQKNILGQFLWASRPLTLSCIIHANFSTHDVVSGVATISQPLPSANLNENAFPFIFAFTARPWVQATQLYLKKIEVYPNTQAKTTATA